MIAYEQMQEQMQEQMSSHGEEVGVFYYAISTRYYL